MGEVVRIEKRKRGFFGKIVKFTFIAFNFLMALWLVVGMSNVSTHTANLSSDAEKAGAAIGTALGAGMIIFIWMAGSVILGILVLLTRGNKVIVETAK